MEKSKLLEYADMYIIIFRREIHFIQMGNNDNKWTDTYYQFNSYQYDNYDNYNKYDYNYPGSYFYNRIFTKSNISEVNPFKK